jgi:hypothetical protein
MAPAAKRTITDESCMKNLPAFALLAAFLLATTSYTQAQSRNGGSAPRLDYEVRPTGLTPAFPTSHVCAPIASAWGSQERFDNSTRLQNRNGGLHGGFDISLQEGTPILAMASGKVIAKGEGGMLEGIYLWLQHTPADTGLPYRGGGQISTPLDDATVEPWRTGQRRTNRCQLRPDRHRRPRLRALRLSAFARQFIRRRSHRTGQPQSTATRRQIVRPAAAVSASPCRC